MPTSSARPDDLDEFAKGSRAADEDLLSEAAKLRAAYGQFLSGCKWGALDAESLLNALNPGFVGENEEQARWVAHIAGLFRAAGGSGCISTLPDAAIAASLRCAGLRGRRSVTFDDPVAFGFPPTSGYANDPVNTATGNFVALETDLALGGLLEGLRFARTYNSRSDRGGPFGPGWASWATARLRPTPEGAEYEGPDGQRALFARMGAGYGRAVGVAALVEPVAAGLAVCWFGGDRWEFDEAGLPTSITRGPGTEVRLRHDMQGRLVALTHEGSKRVDLEWKDERIVAATCSDGRRVTYVYDSAGHLVGVERFGAVRRYGVDDVGRVLSVTDADGIAEVVNAYDEEGRVIEQLSPFGRTTRYAYLPGRVTVTSDEDDGPANTYIHDDAGRLLEIVDGDEQRMTFNYDEWGNPVVVTERGGAVTIREWDERSRQIRRVLPTGAALTFAYDDADRLVEAAASDGAVVRLRYDRDERSPAEVVDPEGGVWRTPVERGLVRAVVDPDGVEVRLEFDADGNLVAAIDADGNVARLERNAAGAVTAVITPLGRRTTFIYDERRLPVERHDPTGSVWRYEYSAAGRLTSVTDPTGAREEIRHGEHGSPTATIDALGHTTSQSYDVFGNLAGVVAADGATWQYGYDALMRPTTTVDPAGATWRRAFDVNGYLVGTIDPVGTHRSVTVDPAGRVLAVSDGLTSSAFEYDAMGLMLACKRADGSSLRFEYDLCGRRVSIQDPVGGITRTEYSPGGRALRTIAPSGRIDENEYDRCGRLAAQVDGAGRRWKHRYDADRALVERIDPAGGVTSCGYDEGGRLVESVVPGAGVTSYEYDAAGRVTAIADRAAGRRTFAYDPAGRLIAATDANGDVSRYSYDDGDRLAQRADPLGGSTERRYDAVGRLVAEIDPLGRTATLTYDAAGRIIEHADGSGRTRRYTYDVSGRVSSFGAAGREPITIQRDVLGREISVGEPGSLIDELRWDPADRLVEHRRGELAMSWRYTADGDRAALAYPDGTETTYSYDGGGRLVGQQHPLLGATVLEHDAAGRLVGATAEGMRARWRYDRGELVDYEFEAGGRRSAGLLERDAVGRVVAATTDGRLEKFSYDPAGQLLSAETPVGMFSFSYDANGRLARETSSAGTLEYEYDAAGQLRARRGDASGITEYEYDGAGRRVGETEQDRHRTWRWDELGRLSHIGRSGPGGQEDLMNVIVDSLGDLAEVDGTLLLWDIADPLSPLAWKDGRAVIGHGSPWALADTATAEWLVPDWQGTLGEVARDPWGAVLATHPGVDSPQLGYRGELEFAGLTWLRDRAYDPRSRSFLEPDTLPAVSGTAWAANPYHYAGNDPVGRSDPLGLRPVTDEELRALRDRMNGGILDHLGHAGGPMGLSPSQVRDLSENARDVWTWANTPMTLPNSRWFTGTINVAYGSYQVGSGITKIIAGVPAEATVVGIPAGLAAQVLGIYNIYSGSRRIVEGGEQIVDATEHPTVRQTPLQYGKRIILDTTPLEALEQGTRTRRFIDLVGPGFVGRLL